MRAWVGRLLEPVRARPSVFHLEDALYGYLVERDLADARSVAWPTEPLNAALSSPREIAEARLVLRRLRLRDFYDHPSKVWDGLRIFSFLIHRTEPSAAILDLGSGPHTNVLRWLELHGYRDLHAIDLIFPRPVRRGAIWYRPGDVHNIPFDAGRFDAAVSQSVIEHGIDTARFFREVRRVLRAGGYLLLSTDYWPEKVDTSGLTMHGSPWRIFSESELRELIDTAGSFGFRLLGPPALATGEPVVEVLGKRYTFVCLVFRRDESADGQPLGHP